MKSLIFQIDRMLHIESKVQHNINDLLNIECTYKSDSELIVCIRCLIIQT